MCRYGFSQNKRGFSPTLHFWLTILLHSVGMTRYRRLFVPGGTYFFTVALADRRATTLVDEIDLLRSVYASVIKQHPVTSDAMVVLPNHLHAVWTLPQGDADFSTRWRKIKSVFSRHCKATGTCRPTLTRKGEKGIWQRRFWEHCIRDSTDYHFHVEYCHLNPVKHGLVSNPKDWPFSSWHRNLQDRRIEAQGG